MSLQTEDSFAKMIIEYVEEQLTFGKPRESIHKELLLSGFDEESIHLVTEVAATNCHQRDSNKRNKDREHGLLFMLAGILMVLLHVFGVLGISSQYIAGLFILSGTVLITMHLPLVARLKPVKIRA